MWVVVAAMTRHWRAIRLYEQSWSWFPALALFAVGFWLYSQSSKNFTPKQLGGIPEIISGHHEQRL